MVKILSPEYLLHISEGAEQIASQLHQEIINRIIDRMMVRIGRGDDYLLTAMDKWNLEVLEDAGYLLEDIQKEIAKKTGQQEKEIKAAMEEAGVKALSYDDKIYQAAGLSPVPLTQSPYMIDLMQRAYRATLGEWKNFTRTTASASQQTFIRAMDKAYHLTASGVVSYTQAVKEAINDVASTGVEVIYPSGHKDTLETATLRAVRTGVSQATAQIQIARMKEMGVALAITSSHMGARPTHEVWQGQVFSIDWEKLDAVYPLTEIPMPERVSEELRAKYPDFVESTGIGKADGLCGINCRHSFSCFYEGQENPFERFDTEENRKAYELSQRQRALERRIRKSKREVMGLKEAVDNCMDEKAKFELDLEYQKKAAILGKQNKAYREFCEENNLRTLNDRLEVAKWDRKQSASAAGAARRYEDAKEVALTPQRNIVDSIRYSKKAADYKAIAQSINSELDSICVKKSRWSGKITVKKNFVGSGRKEWDCSVTLKPDSGYADVLHELIHARSVSYYDENTYKKFYNIEEGATELLTEEICKIKNISYLETYKEQVKHLRRINRRAKLYASEYEFAKELINVELPNRIEWLIKKINTNYFQGIVSDNELNGIWDSFKILVEEYQI